MTDDVFDVAAARAKILAQMATALTSAGRSAEDAVLVGVSKRQPEARIDAALSAGQAVFGENRVQEALTRWSPRRQAGVDVELRLVGPLQTNKARDAAAFFDVIETVDRPKLARALGEAADALGRELQAFVQVNTGEEAQKSGVAPHDADAFIADIRADGRLSLVGLMCIPPIDEPPGPHFALLAKIAARNGLSQLSMGMSADFETALAFGATHVRVGSALFGPRDN